MHRPATSKQSIRDMESLVIHLQAMLDKHLANDISRSYFGDVGVYLPEQFKGPRNSERAIMVFLPEDDDLEDGTRTAASEYRILTVSIVGFVNITSEFKANPSEAFGERRLSRVMSRTRAFLTQQENFTLGGRVESLDVGNITWRTLPQGKNTALRGAGLTVRARVRVPRQPERL